jgi:transposase
MPRKFPTEIKQDVVAVARRGDLSVAEVAVDFGVAEDSVRRWMRQADVNDGVKDGLTTSEQTGMVQLRRLGWRTSSRGQGVSSPSDVRGFKILVLGVLRLASPASVRSRTARDVCHQRVDRRSSR